MTTRPPDRMILTLIELDNHIIGMAAGLRKRGPLAINDVEPLLDAVLAQHASVQGNRTGTESITWDDTRLAFAGTLRICLAYLEQE